MPHAPKITLTGTLTCATAADAAIVLQYLPEHIRLSRAEPGCLSFTAVQTANPLVWQIDETFIDRPAFQAHQTRTRASAWYAASQHIPRAFTFTET
ncbi:MAG: antibiotic biosynthesis monooxygenase [Paracoccaceae bacterium]